MSKTLIRNLCYVSIARYIGEIFEHNNKLVLKELAHNLIEKSDQALMALIKTSKSKLKQKQLATIKQKLDSFTLKISENEFHIVELIGLSLALLDDVSKEMEKKNALCIQSINEVITCLFALNKYFDRKFEQTECYDKAILLTQIMEDIWDE